MYPYEFGILWSLTWGNDRARSAGDIAATCFWPEHSPRRSAQSIAPTLCSLERRGLLHRPDVGVWALTDRGREVVAA